jgi:hypothetical protein
MANKTISQLDPVVTVLDTDDVLIMRAGESYRLTGANLKSALGGSQLGVPVVTRYTVPFNAAGLSNGTGYPLFTPTVGDEILDIAVRFPTVFDGTTPLCDVGTGVTATLGLFGSYAGSLPCDAANVESAGDGLSVCGGFQISNLVASIGGASAGSTPKVTAANPVRVWVTQDGEINGADPASSQGVAEIVFTIVTPIDIP